MGYVLTFIAGGMVGILLTCLMQVKRYKEMSRITPSRTRISKKGNPAL